MTRQDHINAIARILVRARAKRPGNLRDIINAAAWDAAKLVDGTADEMLAARADLEQHYGVTLAIIGG